MKKNNEIRMIGLIDINGFEILNRVFSVLGISRTITAGNRKNCTGGQNPPKVLLVEKE